MAVGWLGRSRPYCGLAVGILLALLFFKLWPSIYLQYGIWHVDGELENLQIVQRTFPYQLHPISSFPTLRFSPNNRTPDGEDEIASELESLLGKKPSDWQLLQLRGRLFLLLGAGEKGEEQRQKIDAAVADLQMARRLAGYQSLNDDLAVAYACRAEWLHHPSDFEIALNLLGAPGTRSSLTPEAQFNRGAILSAVGLKRLALEQWKSSSNSEGGEKVRELERQFHQRKERIDRSRDPTYVVGQLSAEAGALDLVGENAINFWLPEAAAHQRALQQLAAKTLLVCHDRCWTDLLHGRDSPVGRASLSEAQQLYSMGKYRQSEVAALRAEKAFGVVRNTAGRLLARRARILAVHRGDNLQSCPDLLMGQVEEADRRSYKWLSLQLRMDAITCAALLRIRPSLQERRDIVEEARKSGFEGAYLRALSFLTDPEVLAASSGNVWDEGWKALGRFWGAAIPPYRLYHICWNLGQAAQANGRYAAARLLFAESLLNAVEEPDLGLKASVLADLAGAEAAIGMYNEAKLHLQNATDLVKSDGGDLAQRYSHQVKVQEANYALIRSDPAAALKIVEELLSDNSSNTPNKLDEADLLAVMEKASLALHDYAKASYAFQSIAEIHAEFLNNGSAVERQSITHLYAQTFLGQTEALLQSGKSETALWAWEAYRAGRSPSDERTLWRSPDSALLVFAVLPSGISAWMKDAGGVEQHWVSRETAYRTAQTLIAIAGDRSADTKLAVEAAQALYQQLLQPFEKRLNQLASVATHPVLIIDANGFLAEVPWKMLITPKEAEALRRFSLVHTFGWNGKVTDLIPVTKATPIMILADPNPGLDLIRTFPRYRETERIAEGIGKRFQAAHVYTAEEASLDTLKIGVRDVRLVHFIGHGFANDGFGGIILAGPRPRITSRDLSQLQLSGVDLVILEACSAGSVTTGPLADTDTLARSLLDAGAKAVIAPLWPIDLATAGSFAQRFYDALLGGSALPDAVRAAVESVDESVQLQLTGFQLYQRM